MLEHVLQDHKLGLMYSFIGGSLILVIGIAHNLLTVWFSRRRLKRAHSCAPPAKLPHRDPVFGLDELWDTIQAAKAHTYFDRIRQQYRTYGSTFASQTLTYSIINTIEPRNLEAILSSNFKDYEIGFPRRHAFFHLLGNSLILSDGEQWEHSKALLRPSFARSQVSDLAALDVHVENLLAAIPRDGSTVDLGTLFFQLTADATIDLMFGESVHSVGREDDLQADFMRAFQDAQAGGERRFRLGKFVHFVSQRDYYQSIRRVHQFIDAHVEWALRHSDVTEENEKSLQRYIFARELAKMTQDRKVLRSELLTIFLAGRETTSALMTSLFFAIARRPETWRRLRAEVSQLNAAKASYKQLKDLRYLRCCINETLRLYAVVPANSRVATRDTILPVGGGINGKAPVFVAKGTMVAFHVNALHQRVDIWGDDFAEFRPERWEMKEEARFSWAYLPFNGGPRNCMGEQLALAQTIYTAARIIQSFSQIESRDPRPWTETLGVTCTSANGAKVAFKP